MSIEFVEGKCCGDCAKCELPQRPRTTQGMQTCAIANILPMVFCTHDLVIEQNALIVKLGKLVNKQAKELDEIKSIVQSLSEFPQTPSDEDKPGEEQPEESNGKDKDKKDKKDKKEKAVEDDPFASDESPEKEIPVDEVSEEEPIVAPVKAKRLK